jgi:hypothetical protein
MQIQIPIGDAAAAAAGGVVAVAAAGGAAVIGRRVTAAGVRCVEATVEVTVEVITGVQASFLTAVALPGAVPVDRCPRSMPLPEVAVDG